MVEEYCHGVPMYSVRGREMMQKEKDAIERLKAFEPKDGEPYYL